MLFLWGGRYFTFIMTRAGTAGGERLVLSAVSQM